MKKKIFTLAFFGILFTTLFIACAKDQGKLPVTAAAGSACDTITYTKHIKPLIDNTCLSCHGTQPNPGAPVLVTYAQVVANASKIKATTLDANPVPELMPQGGPPLKQSDKDLISCWLGNGMKE